MGSAKRLRPERLGEKFLAIRQKFNFSLSQMAEKLSDKKITLRRTDISKYELNQREPNLFILLRYARLADVSVESLIDDEADLDF